MKSFFLALTMLWLGAAHAGVPADFSGSWTLNPQRSQNLGMMSQMEYSSVITQTLDALVVKDTTKMMGKAQTQETRYALSGAPTANVSYMGDEAKTSTRWEGSHLVTTWTTTGAIAGTTSVRTETRSLSDEAKTMTVQSTNGSKPPLIFVFDRK